MGDTKFLRQKLLDAEISRKDLAYKFEASEDYIGKRLNGSKDWTQEQIASLIIALKLTPEEAMRAFFLPNV